jgi:filamentous hemagglutinin family protein
MSHFSLTTNLKLLNESIGRLFFAGAIALAALLYSSSTALSLPEGWTVAEGEVTVDNSAPNRLVITASDHAIIEFDSFSISQGELVHFIQPSELSSVLSRVTGTSSSEIFGSLYANGQLVLVNSNGIHFASTADVQVSSLIASTLDITNAMYLSDQLTFEKVAGSTAGFILNQANIQVSERGHLVFLSENIENQGVLTAYLGSVILGVGAKQTISFAEDGLINLVIDAGATDRSPLQHTGQIYADGGKIILSVKMLDEILDSLINMEGLIQAIRAVGKDGTVELVANGSVEIDADVNASNVVITEGTKVYAGQSYFTVEKDWINEGEFYGEFSKVELTSLEDSTILGANTFYDFECVVSGKNIFFEAGATQTFLGLLHIEGADGINKENLIEVRSTDPDGLQWKLDSQGAVSVSYVIWGDSWNLGEDLVKIYPSFSFGNNTNVDLDPTWDNGAGTDNWSDGANWNPNGVPTAADTVTFDGTSTANSEVDAGFAGTVATVVVNPGYTGTISQSINLTVTGNFTLNGTNGSTQWNVSSNTLDVGGDISHSGGTFISSGTVEAAGNFTSTTGSLNFNTSTLTFDGAGTQTITTTGANVFNLTVNKTGTLQLGDALSVAGSLTLTAGTLDVTASNFGITVRANWTDTGAGSFTERTGTVTFGSTSASTINSNEAFYDLVIDKTLLSATFGSDISANSLSITNGTLVTDGYELTLTGSLSISASKTLNASSGTDGASTITLGGGWTNNGTFTAGSSTVTLNGTDQTITGSSTFFNLTKTVAAAATLTFAAGSTTTVGGTLTLNGAVGALLSLRSSASGTRWFVNPTGTRSVSFVDVRDSENLTLPIIDPSSSVDSGNNKYWFPEAILLPRIPAGTDTPGDVDPEPSRDPRPDLPEKEIDEGGPPLLTKVSDEGKDEDTFVFVTEGIVDVNGFLTYEGEAASVLRGGETKVHMRGVYVAMADSVKVIRAKAHTLLKEFKWNQTPSDIVASRHGREVYALLPKSQKLSVIKTSDFRVKDIFDLTSGAVAVVLSPDENFAYIADAVQDKIQVMDLKKEAVAKTFSTGSMPLQMALDAEGKYLFVSNYLDRTVSKINTSNGLEEMVITVDGRPLGLVLSKDGTKLFVADGQNHQIQVFDTLGGKPTESIKTGKLPYGVVMDPRGRILCVSNRGEGTVSLMDPAQNKVLAKIKVGRQPSGLSMTPEGNKLYVANELSGDLSLIEVNQRKVVETIPVGLGPHRIAISSPEKRQTKGVMKF